MPICSSATTRTARSPDASGKFSLPGVPPGDYELVTWLPAWEVIRRKHDPESTAVTRQVVFGPHHEWRQFVTVKPEETAGVEVRVP